MFDIVWHCLTRVFRCHVCRGARRTSPPFSAERGPGHVFATWARHKSSAGKVGPRNSLSQRWTEEISGNLWNNWNTWKCLSQAASNARAWLQVYHDPSQWSRVCVNVLGKIMKFMNKPTDQNAWWEPVKPFANPTPTVTVISCSNSLGWWWWCTSCLIALYIRCNMCSHQKLSRKGRWNPLETQISHTARVSKDH